MSEAKPKNQSLLQKLFSDKRFLMILSLFLAVVVWIVFVITYGEDQEIVIHNVPVKVNWEGTVAEQLNLKPFWSAAAMDLDNLTVSVTVTCKPYESIRAGDLEAVLLTGNVNASGEHTLPIQVAHRRAQDRGRFQIDINSITPPAVPLFFAQLKTLDFPLETVIDGEIRVPEGYYAADILFSQRSITISGPAPYVNAITQVNAVITTSELLRETKKFEGVPVVPTDIYHDTPPFLTIEGGAEVDATVLVWKRAALRPALDFSNVPGAYLSRPPAYTISPSSVQAALPEATLDALSGSFYSIGTINFQQLAPGESTFTFTAADLKEIVFLDKTAKFTAEVDMTGMGSVRLTLPGSAVQPAPDTPAEGLRFRDVPRVTVVGPAESLRSLRPEDLYGLADIAEGESEHPVAVHVNNDACWVYGEYTVRVR